MNTDNGHRLPVGWIKELHFESITAEAVAKVVLDLPSTFYVLKISR